MEYNNYKEIEFVCVNPNHNDATDSLLQKQLFQQLGTMDGVIPLLQDWNDYSEGQMSLSALYKGQSIRNQIITLAKQLGVEVDLEQSVSSDYVARAVLGQHDGQIR